MIVNSAFKTFFNNRLAVSGAIAVAILAVFFIASSFTRRSDRDLLAKQANLTVRELGHRLLLQGGDSTSQVLPVMEMKEGTFLLAFEKDFIFNHDSLIALSQKLFTKTYFPSGYTVTVHECLEHDIVYGFQISNVSLSLLPCQGRSQSRGCYTIEIAFPDFYRETIDYPSITLLGGGVLVLLSVALLIGSIRKPFVAVRMENQQSSVTSESLAGMPALGKFLFDVKHRRLLLDRNVIALTEKECRILELLAENFGELISRETLMQQIWLDEGVITGRSLDMFISKLRKKLSSDPDLKITNVHGKGYKLENLGASNC